MSMGKGIVRKNEKVANFEANKQVAFRSLRPFRTAVISFNAPPGKYSIIPLTDKDMNGSRYQLKIYFGTDSSEIGLHTADAAPHDVLIDFVPKNKQRSGPQLTMTGIDKQSLFMPDNPTLIRNFANNPFSKMVMTPYVLDSIINPMKNKSSGTSAMAANKKKFQLAAPFYEDNQPPMKSDSVAKPAQQKTQKSTMKQMPAHTAPLRKEKNIDDDDGLGFEEDEEVAGDQAAAPMQPMTSEDLVSGLPSALFERPEKKAEEACD